MSQELNKDLIDFKANVKALMQKSDLATKTAVESFTYLETSISDYKSRMENLFQSIELKKLRMTNILKASNELEKFLVIIDNIDNDVSQIMQGPKGILGTYIDKLEEIRKIDAYNWIKGIDKISSPIDNKAYSNYQTYYDKYKVLMRNGERVLLQEFQDIIKHYSNIEQMQTFIDYLISNEEQAEVELKSKDKFRDDDDDVIDENESLNNLNKIKQSHEAKLNRSNTNTNSVVLIEEDLFMPKDTLIKLEQICWWFLRREQQYELYNDKNQHCDINQKLKFSETRNEFLRLCLITYSKMNSLGFKKDCSGKFKSSMSKLFNIASSQILHNHNQTNQYSINSLMSRGLLNKSNTSLPSIGDSPSNSLTRDNNLKQILKEAAGKNNNEQPDEPLAAADKTQASSRPVEYIEIFADNLDFSLKLLKHENILVSTIYQKSDETRIDLVSKLTIMVIDIIKNEFEKFFTNSCDFTKISNNGDDVIAAIIRLIVKVHNLKEKTTCLQTEDLSSASKLLQFSIRLNEISSQIFTTYLEVINTGFYNNFDIPYNSSVHEYCKKICDVWRFINKNEFYILDAIKLACESPTLNPAQSKLSPSMSIRNKLNFTRKKNDSDEDSGNEQEKYMRSRRGRGRETASEAKQEANEEFEYSPKWHFAKYYLFIADRLENFLNDEANKIGLNPQTSNLLTNFKSSKSSILQTNSLTGSSNFILNLRLFKACIFMVNNLDYIMETVKEMNILNLLKKMNPEFEDKLTSSINNYIEKSCELFNYIDLKWAKLNATSEDKKDGRLDNSSSTSSASSYKSSSSLSNRSLSIETLDFKQQGTKLFKNPFNDTKKKRKENFFIILKETFEILMRTTVENTNSNETLKSKVVDYFSPIFESLESSGDLIQLANSLKLNYMPDKGISLKDTILSEVYPNSYL